MATTWTRDLCFPAFFDLTSQEKREAESILITRKTSNNKMIDWQRAKELLALSMIAGVGPIIARQLLAHYKTGAVIFERSVQELMAVPNIGAVVAKKIVEANTLDKAEKELELLEKRGILPLLFDSPEYPTLLRDVPSAPLILFYRGNKECISHLGKRTISIVGTRKATTYGREFVQKLVAELKEYSPEITIVSGLAHGIDAEAHRAALQNNLRTLAVLGHGLSYLYPSNHIQMAEQILEMGGLLTEYTYDTAPDAYNFLQRNRLIAGLSIATIVVESGLQGGALGTANYCIDYNRHLFAVPGTVGRTMSQGCNRLIARHKATLIESADDIATILKWDKKSVAASTPTLFLPTEEEEHLLSVIGNGNPKCFDEIVIEAQIPINQLQMLLFQLEFAGQIRQLPGRLYERTH